MRWLHRTEEVICVFLILFATSLLFVNVILRNLGMGISWSEELVRYIFIWITFIGSAICVRFGSHVSIDIINSFLSEKAKTKIVFIASAITLAFLLLMLVKGIEAVFFNYVNGQISPTLSLPFYFIYAVIPLGFFLMIVHYIEFLVIINRKKKQEETEGERV